jgi:glutamate synthase (ferredoxin)
MQSKLYDKSFEHDNCGIGAIVNISGIKTHKTIDEALTIVEQLAHRAGKDAKGETGDGVGILTQIPHEYFKSIDLGFQIPQDREYGVGMFFLPQDRLIADRVKKVFENVLSNEDLELIGWRQVAILPEVLGEKALKSMPCILQCFINKPEDVNKGLDFDRKLYQARKLFEKSEFDNTYVCSLSSRTIVYKGMFLVGQLRTFFSDLQSKKYKSAIAIVHSRFSTNTNPSWERAHPNRCIVHNGEINTIKGNANNMLSREENMETDLLDKDKVYPVLENSGSDSAMLDNALEYLMMAGVPLEKAVMMTIPEPYENDRSMSYEKKNFYEYNATLMEPWDGPASILFTDGDMVGAILDRNGLRPSRYYITKDNYLILASEVGMLDIDNKNILKKDRIRPGKMLLVNTASKKLITDESIKHHYSNEHPYGEWLESNLVKLKDLPIPNGKIKRYRKEELTKLQKINGYNYEDVYDYLKKIAQDGKEQVIAMGNDAALGVLSKNNNSLFYFFKQQFAQVTNPPLDSIREEIVTSTSIFLGKDGNLLKDQDTNCRLLKIEHPILTNLDLLKIKNNKKTGLKTETINTTYIKNTSLEKALEKVFNDADNAYYNGSSILVLSDRGVDAFHLPIPSLLVISALNQHLVRTKKRSSMAIILESSEPFEVHHYAALIGYGASAVNGYLAQDTIFDLIDKNVLDKDYYAAVDAYNDAILHGVVKIASKMGISTIQSYRGSQNFEAIGLSSELINKYFTNTVSRIGGKGIKDIEFDVEERHNNVYDPLGLDLEISLDSEGILKERSNEEEHLYNPATIFMLQQAVWTNDYALFKQFSKLIIKEGESINLRGQLEFKETESISIDEVEPVSEIVKRFKTGAMSYGSISKEAHETIAIAMNRLGGKSNSGEGGEDSERFKTMENGDSKCSAIKQVASGRFGVTSEYLCSAKEIQIKMAQGAKPGEGGQLPATKVYPWIAKTRHSTTGVALISPPPHHDIYSIEDLAQLIYDLKNANRKSRISVKLVSEAGVGTIASGVAKAGAEVILISGYDGGTGAAPKNSVFNAGLPWELGLAETHQTLIQNNLRNRVVIETDGKLLTGRDIAIATLLGAQEFGFATAPLVTMGCIMMRVCNLDTCPVGVATQNPILRKKFTGKPEYVVNFMTFMAQELREYMAKLGFKTIEDMVGHSNLLYSKNKLLNLDGIIDDSFANSEEVKFNKNNLFDFELDKVKDTTILLKEFEDTLKTSIPKEIDMKINNLDRTFGTILGSTITETLGNQVKDDTFVVNCIGAGGQSFGAFIPSGLTLNLTGDTNDYLGKGLSGGKIIIKKPEECDFQADENIIVGNVCFYGATKGEAYINGVAGERFAVRNSGASLVVEGIGDHGCEYMTGGRVVVLGKTGRNFGAGMSGGIAYVYDPENTLYSRVSKELMPYSSVEDSSDKEELLDMISKHYQNTGSKIAKSILKDFSKQVSSFKKVEPVAYKNMISEIKKYQQDGLSLEKAEIQAFNKMKGAM